MKDLITKYENNSTSDKKISIKRKTLTKLNKMYKNRRRNYKIGTVSSAKRLTLPKINLTGLII